MFDFIRFLCIFILIEYWEIVILEHDMVACIHRCGSKSKLERFVLKNYVLK